MNEAGISLILKLVKNWYKAGIASGHTNFGRVLATSIDTRCMPVYQTKRLVSDN
jgi:hypothetical protein